MASVVATVWEHATGGRVGLRFARFAKVVTPPVQHALGVETPDARLAPAPFTCTKVGLAISIACNASGTHTVPAGSSALVIIPAIHVTAGAQPAQVRRLTPARVVGAVQAAPTFLHPIHVKSVSRMHTVVLVMSATARTRLVILIGKARGNF